MQLPIPIIRTYICFSKLDNSLTNLSNTVDDFANKENKIIKIEFPIGTNKVNYPDGCSFSNTYPMSVAILGANSDAYFAPSDVVGTFIETKNDGIYLTRGSYSSRSMIAFLVKVS